MTTDRRGFLQASSATLALSSVAPLSVEAAVAGEATEDDAFVVTRTVARSGFDRQTCWVHARAGAIPAERFDGDAKHPLVVMTLQRLLLTGSDVFYALHESRSSDLGATWTEPAAQSTFVRQTVDTRKAGRLPSGAELAPHLVRDGDQTTVCDFSPMWHPGSQRLLGIGQTVWYRDNHVLEVRPRSIAYAVYEASAQRWSPWKTMELPQEPRFQNAGAGSVQRVDLVGGDVLLPFYFKIPTQKQYSVAVSRCRFDGHTLDFVELGDVLTISVDRGLYEPSMTRFRGTYFLTMRNDQHAYVSVSEDGLRYAPPRRWAFDDGSDLGSYNTQQHWVTHSAGLYLVYTRRGANNDHVFRHRAPLFIARVDPERLCVIRATEKILVPERGARLGNFGVVDVSPQETWVTVSEWMQPLGIERHGSDNSIFVTKVRWKRPNDRTVHGAIRRTQMTHAGARSTETIKPYFSPPAVWQGQLGAYASPLNFADGTHVASPSAWRRRRSELLDVWTRLLGQWPALITDPQVDILETQSRENFSQHRLRFRWTPAETTTAYLLVPDGAQSRPAVMTVYYEPETAIGLGKPRRDFALQLARRGFVALSIGSTEATEAETYGLYHPSLADATVQPLSMLAYAAANAWHVLAARPEVDANRIGIVGHSFGGKWAMFASCLFEKFACAVWSDPGIVFDASRPNVNYWEPWYLGYHPQPWRKRGIITEGNPARGLYPRLVAAGRDLHELHALMAPRPFLVSGGAEDPPHRWQALNHTVAVNRLLGQTHGVAMTNRPDHDPNDDSNEVIYSFFEHVLRDSQHWSAQAGPRSG